MASSTLKTQITKYLENGSTIDRSDFSFEFSGKFYIGLMCRMHLVMNFLMLFDTVQLLNVFYINVTSIIQIGI